MPGLCPQLPYDTAVRYIRNSSGLSFTWFQGGAKLKDFFYQMLLTFELRRAPIYNSEALPFTYGQYVVIELADKLYNSVTVFFCALWKYVFHIGLKQEPNMD